MGWELRRGRRYFYKNCRVGGRVVKHYYGGGELGQLAEELEVEARRALAAGTLAAREAATRLAPLETGMADLDRSCGRLIMATLLAAGFHQHHRTWRKNGPPRDCD